MLGSTRKLHCEKIKVFIELPVFSVYITIFFCLHSVFFTNILVRKETQHWRIWHRLCSVCAWRSGISWKTWRRILQRFTTDSPFGLIAPLNAFSRFWVLSKLVLPYDEWAEECGRGCKAIISHKALAPFLRTLFTRRAIRISTELFIWHYSTPLHPQAKCSHGAFICTAASPFHNFFLMCPGIFLVETRTLHDFIAHGLKC